MDESVVKRFWRKVVKGSADECWAWTGAKSRPGYGVLTMMDPKPVNRLAHRLSWAIAHGDPPPDMAVCHTCDNPPCVNPAHLFLGTRGDNLADMRRKGRGSPPPHYTGSKHHSTPFTEADVLEIRAACAAGANQSAIARKWGVSSNAINRIVHRKSWTHI